MGTGKTVAYFAPLLQHPSSNPHATSLMLFMNAVPEMSHEVPDATAHSSEMRRVMEYMPLERMPSKSASDPQTILMMSAMPLVRDVDKYFDRLVVLVFVGLHSLTILIRYMNVVDFNRVEQLFGVALKKTHSIIEKWPLKLKLRPGQAGARKEFATLLSSGHVGQERYVEWKRIK